MQFNQATLVRRFVRNSMQQCIRSTESNETITKLDASSDIDAVECVNARRRRWFAIAIDLRQMPAALLNQRNRAFSFCNLYSNWAITRVSNAECKLSLFDEQIRSDYIRRGGCVFVRFCVPVCLSVCLSVCICASQKVIECFRCIHNVVYLGYLHASCRPGCYPW